MIKKIIFLFIFAIAVVVGLSLYLEPDDISKCSKNPSAESNCTVVDAIVAVSGGDTNARAEEAIRLYENGWSDILIFSGAAQDKTGPSNAEVMKQIAIAEGVPEASIYIDEDSETTQQNAQNVKEIFTKLDIKRAILVTSGYHQRRASIEFNKYNKNVIILNHPVKSDNDWSFVWWSTPHGWWLASSEIFKIIISTITGIKL